MNIIKAAPSTSFSMSFALFRHIKQNERLSNLDMECIIYFLSAFNTRWGNKPVNSRLCFKFYCKASYIYSFLSGILYRRFIKMGFLEENKTTNTTKLSDLAYTLIKYEPKIYLCNQFLD